MAKKPKPSPDRSDAELCLRRLSRFVKEFWDVIVANPLVWEPHLQILCDEIQKSDERVFLRLPKEYDLIINVPPGSSKTLIVSVLSTCWEFARMSSIRVFVGSYSDGAVKRMAQLIKLVMKSDKYRLFFPNVKIHKDMDSLHNWKTTANGEFYAFTMGGTLTSAHADILKVDDPLNPKQAASKVELESANDFFDTTLPTRKVDKEVTPTYLVMQRLAFNDPTGHLLERKASPIRHICLPGEISNDVKPPEYKLIYQNGLLDPLRMSRDVLNTLKAELGSAGYAGQVQQIPVPDGGLIWQKWFIEIPDDMFPEPWRMHSYGTDWDLAYTEDEQNDPSAFITSGRLGNDIYIDRLGCARKEFPELIAWMKEQADPHHIEPKASGKSAKQTLVKAGINAIEAKVPGRSDKIARAKMATPPAEAGRVYIRKSIADKLYNDSEQGILFFPRGKHDDLADALSQAILRQNKRQIVSSGGSEDSILDYIK